MKELKIIREVFHLSVCNIRNIDNIIHSDDFEIAFNLSNEEEKYEILRIIADLDKDGINIFIERKISKSTPFDQLSIRKLREIGKHMKINNYHMLNKMSLVEEIKNVAQTIKTNCERKHLQSK